VEKNPNDSQGKKDNTLTEVIKTSFDEGRGCYGTTRRIQQNLRVQEMTLSHRSLLAVNGITQRAKQEIFEYIEVFYNRKRRHSANDYSSPVDYEMLPKAA